MLNERTQAKIGIINTDKKKIAEALLECIAPEDLPREYGGTCRLDLGESEEEVNLRAYVASITPSLPPPPHDDDDSQQDLEVEVNLHAAGAGSDADEGAGVGANRAGDNVSLASPSHGDTPEGDEGRGSDERNTPGAARRALGTVKGALSWAGGKFSWRRSPVAHLGDENGFEYNPDLQRWVLRDGKQKGATGGRRASGGDPSGATRSSGGGEVRRERGGSRGHPSSSRRPVRSGSMGSSTSEEMTVLAIQVCLCVVQACFFVVAMRYSCPWPSSDLRRRRVTIKNGDCLRRPHEAAQAGRMNFVSRLQCKRLHNTRAAWYYSFCCALTP